MDDVVQVMCTVINEHTVRCNDTQYVSGTKYAFGTTWFWIYVGIYVALVIFSGKSFIVPSCRDVITQLAVRALHCVMYM